MFIYYIFIILMIIGIPLGYIYGKLGCDELEDDYDDN